MINEREYDDEIDLNTIEQSPMSLKINLRSITGIHKWTNSNEQIRVENSFERDLTLQHFDVQLQVNNGQLQPINRYGVFTSILPNENPIEKQNQTSQTIEPEMDMDNDHDRRKRNSNGYSQQSSGNGSGSYRANRQSNGSSGGGGGSGDGNGWNPNRNSNNSRHDNDDDDESDEDFARRLGFRSIDSETLRTVHRLRNLINQQPFDRRDLSYVQNLIDELIRLQHLENYSQEQLENFVDVLKFDRIFQSKSIALEFIQERFPRRFNRANNYETNSNVFDIWRQRERRSRLDSKDSLEDEGSNIRDTNETNQSNGGGQSKVKQMARSIDTKRIDEQNRSISPQSRRSSDSIRNETIVDERAHSKANHSPATSSEQHRVRQMINRLESSSSSSSPINNNATNRSIPKQAVYQSEYHEQRWSNENNNNNDSYVFRRRTPQDDVFVRDNQVNATRFELDREEIRNGGKRITSGPTIDDYVISLLPNTETSISMVRDVRARIYEDESAVSRTDIDNIPVKVDVETLYILEQKTEKPSTSIVDIPVIYNDDNNRSTNREQHDFATQTSTIPTTTHSVSNRPIGTQVDTTIEQNTVAAQTTDTLHRPVSQRTRLFNDETDEEEEGTSKIIRSTTTTTVSKIIRRRSSHHTSDDEDDDNDKGGNIVINFDGEDNFHVTEQREKIEQVRDINQRRVEQIEYEQDEVRSNEVYEIHTRGACKCLVVSLDEKTQFCTETRFEKQIKRIERSYTDDELRAIELHVIVTTSDRNYRLVRRDYSDSKRSIDDQQQQQQPSVVIHYYTKEGQRMGTEHARFLDQLPLFIRCEIEYELNHYGSAHLIILSITNAERNQMNVAMKREVADETITRLSGRYQPNSPELEQEISRQLAEPISILHLVDYSSRDDYNQTNSTDLRRVTRTDVSTSLRIVQRYRTLIHRLCQQYRSHLRLTQQVEQQRHLILVANNEYYLLDLASQLATNRFDVNQRQHQIFKREVQNLPQQRFDYEKYRRETAQQQRIIEQHYQRQRQQQQQQPIRKTQPSEPEFYLGAGRRALIEREIHSMRESIRPHEHAPPHYKNEPKRRSLSISYSGAQRYVRARIIHVKDYYEENSQRQQIQQPSLPLPNAKEQELFVRVDDYINETAANSLRRSYSTDYLQEDGPRSRIRYIRIPGETIRIEEKTTYEYQGVMYANLPYSLRYWNILQILDREAREGRPLGSSLPHIIVNDPYQTVIPPLTQQEIRQTAQQVLSPQYQPRSHTDQTLRWFLSRDNRTEIESAKYLQTLQHCRYQQQQQQQQQRQSQVTVQQSGQQGVANKYFVTETLVRYEKMPDRLVPLAVHDRAQSIGNLHQRSPSTVQQSFHSQTNLNRSQSQPRPQVHSSLSVFTPNNNPTYLPINPTPLSRHQSVQELHARSTFSQPPSPSPSLHSLHSNYQGQHRRPVAFNNRFPTARGPYQQQGQNQILTEVFDSQTGQRIVTTSQEQLPTAVLGLLNRYNLQQF